MISLSDRIKSFGYLGELLRYYSSGQSGDELSLIREASIRSTTANNWFTPANIDLALHSLGTMLQPELLRQWASTYQDGIEIPENQRTIGVVMAGNLPAVGFHDFLSVLISGHKIMCRLSSDDAYLIPAMAEILFRFNAEWRNCITFTQGKLENFDAVIATGNNNTARHFDYYFGKYPHIIRHNRNSIAILDSSENVVELENVAGDIMHYFGMGCRSVSKLYVPDGYDFTSLIKALEKYSEVVNLHKYANNYEYNRTVFLLNQVKIMDTGFLLLVENDEIPSRIAVVHYSYFNSVEALIPHLQQHRMDIQCVISKMNLPLPTIKPGEGQFPSLTDYADDVDTMKFLAEISK